MYRFIFIIFVVGAFFLGALAGAPAQESPARTAVTVDEAAGTVTIIIEGRPQAVFDNDGLHVNGSIDYGGTLTDDGGAGFRAALSQDSGEHDDAQ